MIVITPESWSPVGIESLESAATLALRHNGSTCIVAGPGAGKTEFLAQRATYLLQTGLCPPPYKILAISFKTDAADNLKQRVNQRCPPEQANRFISLTFDAFTKSLVDRFCTAIPQQWRPTYPYEIVFPSFGDIGDFLTGLRLGLERSWQTEIVGINRQFFESYNVGKYKLPLLDTEPSSATEYAIHKWLNAHIVDAHPSALTFLIINRLAELLLRANPQIQRALRITYPFVFVDEFQDTTYAQYDFLHSAFSGASNIITAVGDDKQRIMLWAGARRDAFVRYENEFGAKRYQLLANFRSSSELVRIQHVIAKSLDTGVVESQSYAKQMIDADVAQIWSHSTGIDEARQIANWVSNDMTRRGNTPRDYAFLVRQTPEIFESQIAVQLNAVGLQLRNESRKIGKTTLQDLFTEEFTKIGLALLRLGTYDKSPADWDIASKAIRHLQVADIDDEIACYQAEKRLELFLKDIKTMLANLAPSAETAQKLTYHLVDFLAPASLAHTYFEYGIGNNLSIAIEAFCLHLQNSASGVSDWRGCLSKFEGSGQIPLMTVHKSKGLEFDTILFIGLDDKAWWSYTPDNPEGMATFFVALSRAKQRAIFTYCQDRGTRHKIRDLYSLLAEAGVPEFCY